MSDKPQGLQIEIKVKAPEEKNNPSPTFGNNKPARGKLPEDMEKVGKHGKSHHTYMKVMSQVKAPKQMKKVTLEQLAQHTKREEAWLALNGVVYDVSVYVDYHPGGQILLKGAGKDASNLFNAYHPWVNAKHLLEKFAVGYLVSH